MKGADLKNFLRGRGWNLSQVADLINETRQNFSGMLSKDDLKTGLIERVSEATNIPLLEFYGAPASEGCSVSGESNIVNNGRDQMASDPGLVAVLNKQAGVIAEQSAHIGQLLKMVENLTKK